MKAFSTLYVHNKGVTYRHETPLKCNVIAQTMFVLYFLGHTDIQQIYKSHLLKNLLVNRVLNRHGRNTI